MVIHHRTRVLAPGIPGDLPGNDMQMQALTQTYKAYFPASMIPKYQVLLKTELPLFSGGMQMQVKDIPTPKPEPEVKKIVKNFGIHPPPFCRFLF